MGFATGRDTPLLAYMFEAVSAFNTVGLSMEVTTELSLPGRVLAILLTYLGRVGPLTFAAAIALQGPLLQWPGGGFTGSRSRPLGCVCTPSRA